jgi:hypothetical protein
MRIVDASRSQWEDRTVAEFSDARWEELRRDLSARVAAFAPDWTERDDNDPGIALVELFGFLAESLLSRGDVSLLARARLREILERLEHEADSDCGDGTLSRPRFFAGKLLTADDLDQEQSYHRTKHRRHNRLLHGVGIVSGLGVGLEPNPSGGDPAIVVSPGVAIAPDGEELVLCEPVTRDLCQGASVCYVSVWLVERLTNQTPNGESSRIEESADAAVSEDLPPGHLAIARLRRHDGAWRSDPTFEVARVR